MILERTVGDEGFEGLRDRLLPDQAARAQLRAELGTYELLISELAPRLRERAKEVLGRDLGEKNARKSAAELTRRVFDRWAEAGGLVPRRRRELPPQSWKLTLESEAFAKDWNERWWWHKDARQAELTVDELNAGPFLTPREYLDWSVDWWAHELHEQTRLNCIEFGCLPIFVTGFVAYFLAANGVVPWWLAVPAGAAAAALLGRPYRWLRHHGYLAYGDD